MRIIIDSNQACYNYTTRCCIYSVPIWRHALSRVYNIAFIGCRLYIGVIWRHALSYCLYWVVIPCHECIYIELSWVIIICQYNCVGGHCKLETSPHIMYRFQRIQFVWSLAGTSRSRTESVSLQKKSLDGTCRSQLIKQTTTTTDSIIL